MATNQVINITSYELKSKHEAPIEPPFADPRVLSEAKEVEELVENDDLLEPIDGLKIKTHDNRIKNRNRRYTKSCEYPEEHPMALTKLSASLPDHFFLNSYASKNWSKKFSKNSRRSRRERSRGLAKKGGCRSEDENRCS